MKVDALRRVSVDLSLGDGDPVENSERLLLHPAGQRTRVDDLADVPKVPARGGVARCVRVRVRVWVDGVEIASDYLGNSVYADPADFVREHYGIRPKGRADGCNYGCYFPDMVRQAIAKARKAVCNIPRMRCASARIASA